MGRGGSRVGTPPATLGTCYQEALPLLPPRRLPRRQRWQAAFLCQGCSSNCSSSPCPAACSRVSQTRPADSWMCLDERCCPRGHRKDGPGFRQGIFFFFWPMCIWLLEDSGKCWALIAAFYKWSGAYARLRFGLSQPWEEPFMTQSSRGCQGGLGFCRWQAGHHSCCWNTLMHDCGASFREQRGCFACRQQGQEHMLPWISRLYQCFVPAPWGCQRQV